MKAITYTLIFSNAFLIVGTTDLSFLDIRYWVWMFIPSAMYICGAIRWVGKNKYGVSLEEENEKLRKQLEYTEAARAKAYKELDWI